jgi:flagellar basal-body rod protein FlgG
MNNALWVAKTGLDGLQRQMTAITNNLANVNTVGYKRGRVNFQDLSYVNIRQPGAQSTQDTKLPSGLMEGSGVKTVSTQKVFTQGPIQRTDKQLDVAIQGRGFIEVQMPDGTTAYTRDGQFQMDENGRMVTASGYPLVAGITFQPGTTSVTIGSDGTVSATINNSATATQVGNLQLADFVNPEGLQPIGDNLYMETVSSGAAQAATPGTNGLGTLDQNAVEGSNVSVVEEMVNMIETQRAYEMNSKAISTVDNMLQYTAQAV